jgi:hypothetical protein
MRNTGNGFFYHRQFFIGNSLSSQIKSSVQFSYPSSSKGLAQIKFIQNNAPFAGRKVHYYIFTEDKLKKKKKAKQKEIKMQSAETDANGIISIDFNANKLKDKRPSITVSYQDSTNEYKRSYSIPSKSDFDFQFFPEGGQIIMGMTNCIAFKAVGSDGLGLDVEGTLYDNDDKKLSTFKSQHLGMGKFCYYPDREHRYYAVLKTAKGETRKINLPRSKPEGFALAAVQKYGKLLVSVRSEFGRMVNDSLRLLGHVRGKVFYNEPIGGFTPAVMFDMKEIEPGIAHFVLVDKKGKSISERMVFVRPRRPANFNIDFFPPVNNKRDKVNAVLEVKDYDGKPLAGGSFSMSITDAGVVQSDTLNENIVSSLFIDTDIKGYIEKPGLYFNPRYKMADEGLDLLMLTQAWRRFDINKAIKSDVDVPNHDMEKAYEISGQVNAGSADKPLKGIQVIAYAPNINYFSTAETDKEGFFFFKNLAFPEKTQFTIQARRKKSVKDALTLTLDEQELPEVDEAMTPPEDVTPVTDTYLQAANEKYYYENGTRSVYSKRGLLSITPQKQEEETLDPLYRFSDEEYVVEGVPLENMYAEDLSTILKKIPSLEGWNETLQPKAENTHEEQITGPKFAIDGNLYSFNEVKNVDVKELESVQILKNKSSKEKKASLDNTLVVLSFKKENPLTESASKQITVTTMPQGYSSNVLFYEPKYEFFSVRSNPLPDNRTTIAFIPDLRTGPTGKALFSFHMADKVSIYNIVIEGVSAQGEPSRTEMQRMLFYKDLMLRIDK